MRILGTLIAPTSGSAVVAGIPPDPARAAEIRQHISIMPAAAAALARTLLNDPSVMFLDEPTSGLDPVAAHEVHGLELVEDTEGRTR